MQQAPQRDAVRSSAIRIGSVSFLNAKPLIYGLESGPHLSLSLDVPSALLGDLQRDELDVALLPVIDYQRMNGLRVLTVGGIGCDGPTLTVRIFSPVPIAEVRTLACDTDSHTSVALARILLAELYDTMPQIIDLDPDHAPADQTAHLLIGDKVVCEEPRNLPHQLDLGGAWKRLTGLPFVFAVWMARQEVTLGDLPQKLDAARRAGLANVEEIIETHAVPRGWPVEVARRYLTKHLHFEIGTDQLRAIRHFHALAHRHGILTAPPRELVFG